MSSSARQGFTLMELAVVLGIIALILGFGVSLGGNAIKSADRINTQQRLLAIQAALDNYAAANGYLPCPANPAQTQVANQAFFGVEQRSGTTCSSNSITVGGQIGYYGMVPVRTLGLPDSFAGDGWGNKIDYAVSAPHVASAASYINNDGTLTVRTGDRSGPTWYTLSQITTDRSTPNIPSKISNNLGGATYVVISHGPDGVGAYPMKGTSIPIACSTKTGGQNDYENCDNSNLIFWDTAYNDSTANTAQFFDDFVVWGSNANQRVQISPPLNTMATISCPANACEAWCAPCSGAVPNLPTAATNGSAFTSGGNISGTLCRKFITSTTPCAATCIWAGKNTATDNTIVRCP